MNKPRKILVDIEIDKLTRSIENTVSGDVFDTEIFQLSQRDLKSIRKADWKFNWQDQIKLNDRETYKLAIKDNPQIIQGLLSISDQGDHIYMHLIESARFNKGKAKIYSGVPGNLVAFACKYPLKKVMKAISLLMPRQYWSSIIRKHSLPRISKELK